MSKNVVGIIIVVILIAVAIFLLVKPSNTGSVIADTNQNTNNNIEVFVLTGDHLRFYMNGTVSPTLKVKQGDKVRIEFTSTEGFHDWVIDEFAAGTERVWPGNATTTVEFIADKKGTFEYYCSVGKHRQNGMIGNLTVE